MALFNAGKRKRRPGVYVRIVNIGEGGITSFPLVPGGAKRVWLLVNEEGTLYPVGPALSLGDSGETVIVADAVNATVYGETLVVKNPGS